MMKRTIKLLGVAAAVLLTFGLAGCPPEPDDIYLVEPVITVPAGTTGDGSEGNPYPLGTKLTFENDGEMYSVNIQWKIWAYNQPQGIESDAALEREFTPTESGKYLVNVSYGTEDRNSNSVYIGGNASTLNAVTIGTVASDGKIIPGGSADKPYTTGTELTADYAGTENVNYQWKSWKTDKYEEIASQTNQKFTPTAAGSYIVTVSAGDKTKDSLPVFVGDSAAALTLTKDNFYGTWNYDQYHVLSDNNTDARKNLQQTIVVTEGSFELTDNASQSFKFTIDTWNEKKNENQKNGITGNYGRPKYEVAFPKGYRLTGNTTSPSNSIYGTTKELILYMNEEKNAFVRVSSSGGLIVSCVYVKTSTSTTPPTGGGGGEEGDK